MKKQSARRVVILDNLGSHGIEQAIFILKEDVPLSDGNVVFEANRIAHHYVMQMQAGQYRGKQKKKWFGWGK